MFSGKAQTSQENEIRRILQVQAEAWNQGNIEKFMQTYWKSDSLLFIGKNGVRKGWSASLQNYKKSYPDTASMGQLSFELIDIKKLSPDYYFVVGKWMLVRSIGNISGHFDLLIKRFGQRWLIISDHSS